MKKIRVNYNFRDAASRLAKASNLQDIHQICSEVCRMIDIPHFNYISQIPVSMVSPEHVFINNYPEALWSSYRQDNLLLSDPVFRHCAQSLIPILWSNRDSYIHSDEDTQFMHQLEQHDLCDGISFPLRPHKGGGVGVMSFISTSADTDVSDYLESLTSELMLFGTHVHSAVNKLAPYGDNGITGTRISRRERECLLWTSEGKTTDEIGLILGISVSTVTFHIQNIARKLNVSNRQQAVARGISLGIISPQPQSLHIREALIHSELPAMQGCAIGGNEAKNNASRSKFLDTSSADTDKKGTSNRQGND